ncbi:MAG TPA: flavin-dependent oxidoreductase [Ilumatobacter sp.]|nr:flavin-dependent oxidoreductase [Ilumatobacter sp.]
MTVVVAGGGIGGLVTALSLHQIGVDVEVFESVVESRALGVGINLLPHAVRELDALGLLEELGAVAVAPTTLAYFTKRGQAIWTEPRGIAAGYAWPQISIHRGHLHTVLLNAVLRRLGHERVHFGHHVLGADLVGNDSVTIHVADRNTASEHTTTAEALIAADGIHSAVRAQFYPDEGVPRWNGALLWRGLAEAQPVLDGKTMVWAGHPGQKFVGYPVANLVGGLQLFNFIAELRTGETTLAAREDWNRAGDLADFLPQFESWTFDWLDVPALIRSAAGTFVFPMVDRDPIDRWSHGRITLLGDAAHPMYPIGSNGASQAILDARVLAGCLRSRPADIAEAFARYDEIRRPATSAIVLANRGMGPELPMQLVEERAPDGFASIDDVITRAEIDEVTDGYRRTAGFALAALSDGISLADRDYS